MNLAIAKLCVAAGTDPAEVSPKNKEWICFKEKENEVRILKMHSNSLTIRMDKAACGCP